MTDKLRDWPVELRAAIIGAVVGMLEWIAPGLVGSGDPITESGLDGTLAIVPVVFLIRFGLGAVSYAARDP